MSIFFVAPFHRLDEYQGNVEDFAVCEHSLLPISAGDCLRIRKEVAGSLSSFSRS
jgi:hypothetical protein